ncbi:hypothetical protein QYM36_003975 [Artemia franciscana]|uniref:CCHC-type domain-containing protein n=1 Tax=Artemia franciscana TaxID=6661 RepID=A0AA88LD30_ARTSF|nr:hypothetical protein QYM36_003975 [Artemia franciscana]
MVPGSPGKGGGCGGVRGGPTVPNLLAKGHDMTKITDTNDKGMLVPLSKTSAGYLGRRLAVALGNDYGKILPRIGPRGSLEVVPKNLDIANKILGIRDLTLNNIVIKFEMKPENMLYSSRKGVLYVPRDLATPEELCKEIQQVEQVTKATVLNPHPTSRDGKPYTSYTIHDDFSQEMDFPTIIPIWSALTVVKQFIPKPLRCFKCQKFGHNSLNCWGKDTCGICGDNHPMTACPELNKNRNEQKVRCANCNGQHTALSKECQDYKFRAAILKTSVTKGISFKDAVQAFTDTKGKTLHTPPPALNFEHFPVLVHPSIPPEAKIQEPINKEVVLLREKIDQLTTVVSSLCSLIASSVKLSKSSKSEVQKILSSLKKSESFVSGNETDSEDGMDEDNFVPKKILSSPEKKTLNKRVHKQKIKE